LPSSYRGFPQPRRVARNRGKAADNARPVGRFRMEPGRRRPGFLMSELRLPNLNGGYPAVARNESNRGANIRSNGR
jgi:hypothetical protein